MNKNHYFWGILLVIIGLLFFLQSLGIIQFQVTNLFFPIIVILIGGWMIMKALNKNVVSSPQELDIPAAHYSQADLEIRHGGGRLKLTGATDGSSLVKGTFSNGIAHKLDDRGNSVSLLLEPPGNWMDAVPFGTSDKGFEWNLELNPQIVYNLALKTGAGETRLDLRKLKITDIRLNTGASATKILLPETAGTTHLSIKAGMASVEVNVPENVAAQIKIQSGLSDIKVNQDRFGLSGDGRYVSNGFETAENKIYINIEGGFGSFEVK